jgi:hypothetical protein
MDAAGSSEVSVPVKLTDDDHQGCCHDDLLLHIVFLYVIGPKKTLVDGPLRN